MRNSGTSLLKGKVATRPVYNEFGRLFRPQTHLRALRATVVSSYGRKRMTTEARGRSAACGRNQGTAVHSQIPASRIRQGPGKAAPTVVHHTPIASCQGSRFETYDARVSRLARARVPSIRHTLKVVQRTIAAQRNPGPDGPGSPLWSLSFARSPKNCAPAKISAVRASRKEARLASEGCHR